VKRGTAWKPPLLLGRSSFILASMTIDWTSLWHEVESTFRLGAYSLHGPAHWKRVERHGIELAGRCGADVELVRLFAVLHDSCRWSEGHDPEHGARGAELASRLCGRHFELDDDRLALLTHACTWHDRGLVSEHPTVGACWDADRLDLGRVGLRPDPAFMSTDAGRLAASSNPPGRTARPR